jgi:hypothetical protein
MPVMAVRIVRVNMHDRLELVLISVRFSATQAKA